MPTIGMLIVVKYNLCIVNFKGNPLPLFMATGSHSSASSSSPSSVSFNLFSTFICFFQSLFYVLAS